MKLIKSILLTVCVLFWTACSLDMQDDLNSVQPTQTVPGLLLNSMQRNLAVLFNASSTQGMQLTRLQATAGSTYANIFNPQSFDVLWNTGYASILQDADVLIKQADREGLARHAGMARVISAYTLLLLVDVFGDVPYSQAFQGFDNLNPAVDDESELYTTIIALLDKAEEDFTTPTTTATPAGYLNATAVAPEDLYYANNYTRWRRFANSIKLKLYLNLRLTDPATATTGINNIIAAVTAGTGVGFIGTSGDATDNFAFRYGTSATDPDARHPRFVATYPAGGGNYMSNWLMWHMYHGYNATHTISSGDVPGDPRMRFYFYRQRVANSTDPNQIRCVTASGVPAHYPQKSGSSVFYNPAAGAPPLGTNVDELSPAWTRTFCYPTNVGYWGRDFVNNEGIPPDAFLRTLWGAYPAGGRFDANNAANVSASQGMRGAGLQPIMMRSFVDFMLAEAALYLGIIPPGADNTAALRFVAGIRNSMNDVRSWTINGNFGFGTAAPTEASLITGNTAGVGINTFYTQAAFDADVNDYVAEASNSYAAQGSDDTRMNYIAREYWIALFGNGVEAYNLYRRTGMPTGMQPALNASPGTFPRSLWYPATFATLNSTVEQKANLSQRLFWDTNASNLDF